MRLVMMGTGTFAQPTLECLLRSSHQVVALVTQPDRAVGQQRGSTRLAEQGMKEIAVLHKVPVYQPESINTPEGIEVLRGYQPDLLVVAAYGQILARNVLAAATHGGINVHASLLPKYRGAAPIAWAIYHGETRTGVTIIRMSIHLDAGDVLAQDAVDILPDETAGQLETRLGPLGARLAMETVDRLAAGPVAGLPQDRSLATKAPKLKKEDGLIDWNRHADRVCNHIRAMQPWPTAYTFLHRAGQPALRMIINSAVAFPVRRDPSVPPGTLFTDAHCPGSLFVAAGAELPGEERSVVEIRELQPAAKRRMTAAEFLRGRPTATGDHFGPETP